MKKYRVTEKHELLNEGIIIKEVQNGTDEYNDYVSDKWAHLFSMSEIKSWMVYGWIKEIQKPKFTRDDIIDCMNYFNVNNGVSTKVVPDVIPDFFNDWIKWRKDENKNKL